MSSVISQSYFQWSLTCDASATIPWSCYSCLKEKGLLKPKTGFMSRDTITMPERQRRSSATTAVMPSSSGARIRTSESRRQDSPVANPDRRSIRSGPEEARLHRPSTSQQSLDHMTAQGLPLSRHQPILGMYPLFEYCRRRYWENSP